MGGVVRLALQSYLASNMAEAPLGGIPSHTTRGGGE